MVFYQAPGMTVRGPLKEEVKNGCENASYLEPVLGQLSGNIFRHMTVQGQKMVKLAQHPDPGFSDMNRRGLKICAKFDNMLIFNPFN